VGNIENLNSFFIGFFKNKETKIGLKIGLKIGFKT
jgi:hypothetical protein